jgi:hypothetical protein
MLAAAQQMKQQANRCSRLVRAAMLAVNVVRQEHRLHLFRFIVVIEKLAEASGEKGNQLRNLRAGDPAEAFPCAKQIAPAVDRRSIDLRRRLHKKRLQIAREFFKLVIDLDKSLCVLRRDLAELCLRTLAVSPPWHHVPIREGNLNRRIAWDHAQTIICQPQLCNHFGPQHARDIRSGRNPASGSNLFGHATSANDFAPLEYKGGKAGPRQICSRS